MRSGFGFAARSVWSVLVVSTLLALVLLANSSAASDAPAAPSNLLTTATSRTSIYLDWDANSGDESGFEIERRTGSGPFIRIATVPWLPSSYSDTGLADDTDIVYTYRVRAIRGDAVSAYSNEALGSGMLGKIVRMTLSRSSVKAGETVCVTVTLDGPASAAGARLHLYVGISPYAVTVPPVVTVPPGETSVTFPVTAVPGRVQGYVEVNAAYTGEDNHFVDFAVVPDDAWNGPSYLQIDASWQTSLVLLWSADSRDELGTEIERRSGDGLFRRIATLGAGVGQFTDGDVSAATSYTYRVRGLRTGVSTAYSNEASATTLPPKLISLAFAPPQVAGGDSTVGTVALDVPAPARGFAVRLASDHASVASVPLSVTVPGGKTQAAFPVATQSVVSKTTVSISAFTEEQTQRGVLTVSPAAVPAAPTGLQVSALTGASLQLRWTDSSRNEAGFEIERKTKASAFGKIATVSADSVQFVDAGLSGGPDEVYTYRVRAINVAGPSAYSNEASGSTPPVSLASLKLDPAALEGGGTSTGTVALDGPAPPGGAVVSLASDAPAVARVPETVTIPGGATSVAFQVLTGTVTTSISAIITAGYAGHKATATIVALPSPSSGGIPPAYTIEDLGTLGGSYHFARKINDAGQVVGVSAPVGSRPFHAFRWIDGVMQDLGTLGGAGSYALGVNRAGQSVGWANTADGATHPFLWTPGRGMEDLSTLRGASQDVWSINEILGISDSGRIVGSTNVGGTLHAFQWSAGEGMRDLARLGDMSGATATNEVGEVVGWYGDSQGSVQRGFLWTAESGMQALDARPARSSIPYAINNLGEVVGYLNDGNSNRAYRWSRAAGLQELDPLNPGHISEADDINDAGQIVGVSVIPGESDRHPFVYTAATGMVDLNTRIDPALGWRLDDAYGINNAGQIVGVGFLHGEQRLFRLTPTSLPPPGGHTRPATVAWLTLSPDAVSGGSGALGRVTLDAPAPAGGAVIALVSGMPGVAAVPATMTVPEGATTATFPITTTAVSTDTSVTVSATYGVAAETWKLMVRAPVLPPAPADVSVSGATQTQLTLSWADRSTIETGFEVERRSGDGVFSRIATVGANVTTITNSGLTPGTRYIYRVRAISADGVSTYSTEVGENTLSILMTAFRLSPTLLQVGLPVSGTITIDSTAPAGGTVVTLTSDSPSVTVPENVVVLAGATEVRFTAATSEVESRRLVKITAALGGGSREAAVVLLPAAQGEAKPPGYWIVDLGLSPGGGHTQAYGINDAGQVVGDGHGAPRDGGFLYDGQQIHTFGHNTTAQGINAAGYVVGGANGHAFLYDGTEMRDLGVLPGSATSTAYGINATGQVVGISSGGSGGVRAFLSSGGVMQDLGALNGGGSFAYGINASGRVAGNSGREDHYHAFLHDGAMRDLGTLGGAQSFAYGINDAGQVVGWSTTDGNSGRQAFLYDGTGMYDLGFLGGPADGSAATSINNRDQIVGNAMSSGGDGFHAFLWQDGRMYDLNELVPPGSGWVVMEATGINDAGQIACIGRRDDQNLNGQNSALLLTPYTVALPPLPEAPSDLEIREPSQTEVTLIWKDASLTETGFAIERKAAGGDWHRIAATLPNATSFQDTGLDPHTAYSYRVRANGAADGSAWSNEVGGTTTGGSPAVGISFSALSLPKSLAFGDQSVGTPSAAKTITLTNTGTAPLAITSVTLKGLEAAEFVLVADSGEGTMAPGGKRIFTLRFAPAEAGSRAATLVIADNAPGSPHAVELGGTGVGVRAQGIAVFRPATCEWFFRGEEGRATVVQFGGPGDVPVPADFLGLGHPQLAAFRPVTREWLIRAEDGSTIPLQFGGPGDVPVPGDYLGLGRASIAVYRRTTREWFVRRDDGTAERVRFGGLGDVPVPADYFGLGRASLAMFRPGTGEWFLRQDDGNTVPIPWGAVGDVPVAGDYLGLHRAQLAVFRPSTREWFVRQDDGKAVVLAFGGAGDVPAPGDYFGVGRWQIGVYRPGEGTWYLRTDLGGTVPVAWGGPEDWPLVRGAFPWRLLPLDAASETQGVSRRASRRPTLGTSAAPRAHE